MNKLITACMIVKDEEKVLNRCLSSIKDYVDEIVIVDTGSTDRTKEIASAYTDRIYDYKWINDFSAARNESIKHATSQLVLIIDADEYFPPAEAHKLREFLQLTTPQEGGVYTINIISLMGDSELTSDKKSSGPVLRLFPNNHNIFYTRPIHEQLVSLNGTSLRYQLAPCSLFHTGYLQNTVIAKNKATRNNELFAELKKKQGFSAYDYFTLGNELASQRDLQHAIENYEIALKMGEQMMNEEWYPRCTIALTKALLGQNRFYDAWRTIETKLSSWNQYPEYFSLKGMIYYRLGLFDQAKQAYMATLETAMKLAEHTHLFWLDNPNDVSTTPLLVLYQISSWEDDMKNSIHYLSQLLIQNPYNNLAMKSFITLLSQSQSATDLYQLLERFMDTEHQKFHLFVFNTSVALGKKELATIAYEKLTDSASIIEPSDRINYALLTHNKVDFDEYSTRLANETHLELDTLITLTLGSFVWDTNYLSRLSLSKDHDLFDGYQLFIDMIQGKPVADAQHHYRLLRNCYLYQCFDLYDQLVNTYNNTDTTNALANFFYSEKQYELAMSYYSILLKNDSLNAASLENLAMYHLYHHYIDDGLDFLLQLIEKRPDELRNYSLYVKYCSDPDTKQQFLHKHDSKFASFRDIPAFASLY